MADGGTNDWNRAAWDSYQDDYMRFQLAERPDYFTFFAGGGVYGLDDFTVSLVGDVRGLKLLDTCCACDASQAFSWHNLGADVTACDISPRAIEIASRNAHAMGLDITFVVADAQTLAPVEDEAYDVVFATYPVWLEDLGQACRAWRRVLRRGGRLVLVMEHPITSCLADGCGALKIVRNYNVPAHDVYEQFRGTPLADRHGGFTSDVWSVEHFYRISDVLNAIACAPLRLTAAYESAGSGRGPLMDMLPCDMVLIAEK